MARTWITRLFEKRRRPIRFAPRLTHLEARDVPATFFVDPDAVPTGGTATWNEGRPDEVTGPFKTGVDGSVYDTLVEAIDAANTLAGPDIIMLSHDDSIFFVTSTPDTPVAITESVDFVGAGAGVSIIQTDPANDQPTAVLVVQGAGVVANFTDVTFFGGAGGFDPAGTGDVVGNDSVTGRFLRYEAGTSGTIDRAVIQGVFAPFFLGIGISAVGAGTDVTVQNSSFSNIGRVGVAAGTGANVTLTNNTYTGKGAGLFVDVFAQLVDGATGTITGNTVTGNQGIDTAGDNSAAVIVSQGGGAASTATITGNFFSGNSFGIIVGDNVADTSNADIQQNNLDGNLAGVGTVRDGTTPVNAPNNFWGGTNGPFNATTNPTGTGSDVADDVTFAPFSDTPFPAPVIEVTVQTTQNAEEPSTAGTFRFTRTGDTTAALTVNYTVGGSATAGTDYTTLPGTVTFAAGSATADVTVTPIDDTDVEGTETVSLTITADPAYTVIGSPALLTIADDDVTPTPPSITVQTTANASEPSTAGTLRFTRTGSTATALTVNYTVGGSATAGTDYQTLSGTVTFGAGAATVDVAVTPIDDTDVEGTETVTVTVSPDTAFTVVGGAALVSIADDDAAPALPGVTVQTVSNAAEPTTAGTLRFTRTGDTSGTLTVNYTVAGTATAGADYQTLSGTVTFAAGAATVDVLVTPIDDTATESTETVIVTITTDTAFTVIGEPALLSIADDDDSTPTTPTVTVARVSDAAEPSTAGTYRFTRTGDTSTALTLNYTVGGTATAGTDYTALSGTVTFAAGAATVDVAVTPIDDNTFEGTETVLVTVTAGSGFTIVGGPALLAITDNEPPLPPPLPTVTVSKTADAAEPSTAGNFRFTRTGSTTAALTVSYTVGGMATAGTDYTALSGTVTFAAGQATVDVPLTPIDDTAVEGSETVLVTILAGPDFTGGGSATAMIADDDTTPPVTTGTLSVGGSSGGTANVFVPTPDDKYTIPPSRTTPSIFPGFTGEVRTATGDFDGDGVADTVLVTGPGTKTLMAVVSGADNSILLQPSDPFGDANFTFGGFVTAGDIDGNGQAEWVVTPELRGGPRVIVFGLNGSAFRVVANFFGIGDPNFRDGDRAALGDVNGDGILDVFSIAAFNGGPRTALYDGADVLVATSQGRDPRKLVGDFFATLDGSDSGRGGRSIAAGDINGDGFADFIVTGDNLLGTGNQVTVYSGADLLAGRLPGAGATTLANFTVGGQPGSSTVSLTTVLLDGDDLADLVVGSGAGQTALIKVYYGTDVTAGPEPTNFTLAPFDGVALNGVFVG